MFALGRHLFEQRIHVLLQHRRLIQQCGVYQGIGVFLIGEYPPFLAPPYAGPHAQSLLHGGVAGLVIPYQTAQYAYIRGAYAVVVVKVQGGKGAYIYPEYLAFVHSLYKLGIKAVYAFDYQRLILPKVEQPALRCTACGLKIKLRNLHLFSPYKGGKVPLEAGDIQRIYVFKVYLAIFIRKYFIPIDIVIIQRKHYRIQPMHPKLGGKPVGGGGLAGGRGTCQHYGLCSLFQYLIRHLGISALVQHLVYSHKFPYAAAFHGGIELMYGIALHQPAPFIALVEYRMELWQLRALCQHIRRVCTGHHQHHRAVPYVLEAEHIHI